MRNRRARDGTTTRAESAVSFSQVACIRLRQFRSGYFPKTLGVLSARRRRARAPMRRSRSARCLARQLDDAGADHAQLAVLIARFLRDLDQVTAPFDERADDVPVDTQRITLGIVTPDLRACLA